MVNTTHLGGSASNVVVGRISHGLMTMHLRAHPEVPDEVCFASIKAGVDRLPAGAKMFLNSGEFYSHTWGLHNLEMLGRFYAKYPEYADKTFLSVKGAVAEHREPDCSMENMRKSVGTIARALGPHKKLDLFQPARIDRKLSIEKIMGNLVVLLKEGHFSHIGLSECTAETLRRAHAVYPITAAEIEVSLTSYEPQTKKVIETARELGVSVLGYSPVGRGLLTGKITSAADIAPGDYRHSWSRFKDGNLEHNVSVVSVFLELAVKKGVTPAQLAIAWVAALGLHVIPLPGSSNPERTLENCAAGDIELSAEEMATLNEFAESVQVKGTRMTGGREEMELWG
ncbi:Aldo/keto reductase [Mycena venus]|uniref:Aldo/keto reductase n=1 Tax=Mycena venus TaxID=2733690 RepID=A0A8H6YIL6_9AGAR|nr:Aldo/keto reductase [Mycena venus]